MKREQNMEKPIIRIAYVDFFSAFDPERNVLAANPLRHGMDFSPKRDIADYLESIIRRGNKPFEKDAWEFGDAARLHRLARGASPFALRLRYLLACLIGADRQRRHALKNALRDLKQLHR